MLSDGARDLRTAVDFSGAAARRGHTEGRAGRTRETSAANCRERRRCSGAEKPTLTVDVGDLAALCRDLDLGGTGVVVDHVGSERELGDVALPEIGQRRRVVQTVSLPG